MLKRLLVLALIAAGVAVALASRRRGPEPELSQNGGSRQRAADLQRELERQ